MTDEERAKRKRSDAARGQRSQYSNESDRKQVLGDDSDVLSFTEYEVTCKGCKKPKSLQKGRKYDLRNWNAHKAKCPGLNGTARTRTRKGAGHGREEPEPNVRILSLPIAVVRLTSEMQVKDARIKSQNPFSQWGFVSRTSQDQSTPATPNSQPGEITPISSARIGTTQHNPSPEVIDSTPPHSDPAEARPSPGEKTTSISELAPLPMREEAPGRMSSTTANGTCI